MRHITTRKLIVSSLLLAFLGTGCSRPDGDTPHKEDRKSGEHGDEAGHVEGGGPDSEKRKKDGHADEGEEPGGHEEGVVELSPEAFARAKIRTAKAELRELPAQLETTGEVGFNQNLVAHVSPRIPGRVHKVKADLGETVKAGEPLAILDSIELGKAHSEYFQAQAQLELAKQTLEREEKLLGEKIASEKEVQEARAEYQKASAEFTAAEGQLRLYGLSRAQIRGSRHNDPESALFPVSSPLGGVVIKKHITLGELMNPDTEMYTIADTSRLWIWLDVYERNLAQVHKDDDVSVQVDTYPDQVFRGKVTYIGDEVNTATRAVRARVDVENPGRALKPGMFARVRLTDPHAADGKANGQKVLAVPSSAVQRDGDQSIVFVVAGERRFIRRVIKVGASSGDYVGVAGGLEVGEQVVADGVFLLKSEAAKESMGEGHSH